MNGVVMLAQPGEPTAILYHALRREFSVDAVILEEPIGRVDFLRRRARRLGWPTVLGQVAFVAGVVPLLRRGARQRIAEIKCDLGLDDMPIDPACISRVPSANAPETRALLEKLAPRVVVVNGTRILSAELLAGIHAPFVNVHAGITPLYRGVHGGYWALVENRRDSCGVTIHLVDEGIDTGTVLGQAIIEPTARDCFVTYHYLQLAAAIPLLRRAVADLLAGHVRTEAVSSGPSRLRTHPTVWQYAWNRARKGVR